MLFDDNAADASEWGDVVHSCYEAVFHRFEKFFVLCIVRLQTILCRPCAEGICVTASQMAAASTASDLPSDKNAQMTAMSPMQSPKWRWYADF